MTINQIEDPEKKDVHKISAYGPVTEDDGAGGHKPADSASGPQTLKQKRAPFRKPKRGKTDHVPPKHAGDIERTHAGASKPASMQENKDIEIQKKIEKKNELFAQAPFIKMIRGAATLRTLGGGAPYTVTVGQSTGKFPLGTV